MLQNLGFFSSTDNDLIIFLGRFISVYRVDESTLFKRREASRAIERIRNKTSS